MNNMVVRTISNYNNKVHNVQLLVFASIVRVTGFELQRVRVIGSGLGWGLRVKRVRVKGQGYA